jgi:4-diphosphocytidyl-2C-methyl-D-erythritol kinase
MQIKAYAKINWDLHVLGRRPDGFHALDTVMVNVSVHDTLEIEAADSFSLSCDSPDVPVDGSNLISKAAQKLAQAAGRPCGARIHLIKRIPMGGGMGGGSSDGAAALVGLNQSRGEVVEALVKSCEFPAVPLLLIFPALHVATPSVYKALNYPIWDGKSGVRALTDLNNSLEFMLTSLQSGRAVPLGLRNDLTVAAQKVEPKLTGLQLVLEQNYTGRWLMSGSGSTHFVVPDQGDDGTALAARLNAEAGPGVRVLTATTCTP